MKYFYFLVVLFGLFLADSVFAGTCSSISRTNNAANSVLTSTKYNTDLNTVYNQVNDLDGGCVTDNTLEAAALNSTEFAVLLNGLKEGCLVERSDTNTISVGKCRLSINGNFISTTTNTTVTWGCTGCSAEATQTLYYVYAQSNTSLDLLISTTAPDNGGLSGTSKVLGRFYNDQHSDIATDLVSNWTVNKFIRNIGDGRPFGAKVEGSGGTGSIVDENGVDWLETISTNGTGDTTLTIRDGFFSTDDELSCVANPTEGANSVCFLQSRATSSSVRVLCENTGGSSANRDYNLICTGKPGDE